jgi:hypothetical protein
MYRSNAPCCDALRTSPVVSKKTTALYVRKRASVKKDGSSVASTAKPFLLPSSLTAATAAGIDE